MTTNHCPYCNGKKIAAIAPVAYSGSVLVEHRCGSCGHLFCIMDRRDTKPLRAQNSELTTQLLSELRQRNQSKRWMN